MPNIGIYYIKNMVSDKIYIGQSRHLNKRKYEHFKELKGGYHFNLHLQRAFDKYGENEFDFGILETCKENDLNDKECEYIKQYNSMKCGYNLRSGGHNPKLSEESKLKISKTRKERIANGLIVPIHHVWTEEEKHRASEAQKKFHKDNPLIKEKLSISLSTISINQIRKIKLLLYLDADLNEIVSITGVGIIKIRHIASGNTFNHVYCKLNWYIENRIKIAREKQIAVIIKKYRNGDTYQSIADLITLNIRNVIRILNKYKTNVDEIMREKTICFYNNEKNNMIKRMYAKGWSMVKISKFYNISRVTVSKILSTTRMKLSM